MLTEKLDIYSFQVSLTISDILLLLQTGWQQSKWRRDIGKHRDISSVKITKQIKPLSDPYRILTNNTNISKYSIADTPLISINKSYIDAIDALRKSNILIDSSLSQSHCNVMILSV